MHRRRVFRSPAIVRLSEGNSVRQAFQARDTFMNPEDTVAWRFSIPLTVLVFQSNHRRLAAAICKHLYLNTIKG
jgi:hypothetical protein